MARNLVTALFHHGRIVTTEPKAKEYRPMAEKLITLGRTKSLHHVRRAAAVLRDRRALDRLFNEIGPSFAGRPGGYTRIVRLPTRRLGDKGTRVYFELVNFVPTPKEAPAGEARPAGKDAGPAEPKAAKGGKTRGKGKGGSAEADESEA
jgi:large subunit ribosomal protein L17